METRDLLKRIYYLTISSSLICFILGLLIFMEADIAVKTVSVIAGVILILLGIWITARYVDSGVMRYFFGYSLLYAMLDILAGILMIAHPSIMSTIIALFVTFSLLLESILKVQTGLLFKEYNVSGWGLQFFLAVLSVVCAFIIIINPNEGTIAVTKVIAVIIMSSSLIDLVNSFIIKEKAKNLKKSLKDILD